MWCNTCCDTGEASVVGPQTGGTGLTRGTCRCLAPQPF
jgi:hypothetical protein